MALPVIVATMLATSFIIFALARVPASTVKAQSAASYNTGTVSFTGTAIKAQSAASYNTGTVSFTSTASISVKRTSKGVHPLNANCLSISSLNNTVTGTNNFSVSGQVRNGCGDTTNGTLTFTVTAECGGWSGTATGGADFSAAPGATTPTLRLSGIAGCAVCDTNGRFLAAPPFTLIMNAQATGFLLHQGGNVYSNNINGPSRTLNNSSSFSRSLCPFS